MGNFKKTEFIVRLDGIELSDELHKSINTEIQDVVMRNLAKFELKKNTSELLVKRRHWYGYWIRNIKLDTLQNLLEKGDLVGIRDTFQDISK